ncbi:TrmH family RNA methyltransferase, partial [Candidatus Dojkabacteria bacterium]
MNTRVILDNIRSIHNVGSIFRTSSGAGVSEIILVGITPGPQDLRLSKTALGAEKEVQYSLYNNFREFKNSKSFDLSLVVSVEQDDRSIGLREFTEILKK